MYHVSKFFAINKSFVVRKIEPDMYGLLQKVVK